MGRVDYLLVPTKVDPLGRTTEVLTERNMSAGQGNVQSDAEDEVGEDIPMEEEPLASDEDEERESPEAGVYK